MRKIELVVVLIILGILGLHYTFITQPQETPKDQMKKNQTNNKLKKQRK
jgi:preprotein translocase subunit YajC